MLHLRCLLSLAVNSIRNQDTKLEARRTVLRMAYFNTP